REEATLFRVRTRRSMGCAEARSIGRNGCSHARDVRFTRNSGSTDRMAWTAAIQTDLRETFGGIRHSKDYRPTYALVEVAEKRAIIKINDCRAGQTRARHRH